MKRRKVELKATLVANNLPAGYEVYDRVGCCSDPKSIPDLLTTASRHEPDGEHYAVCAVKADLRWTFKGKSIDIGWEQKGYYCVIRKLNPTGTPTPHEVSHLFPSLIGKSIQYVSLVKKA